MKPLTLLAINGSLRAQSFNRRALEVAKELAPAGVELEIVTCAGIPLFNEDVEADGVPVSVERLGEKIRRADGIVLASPEYNFSISGVLKNTIDWLSRLPSQPLKEKPVAIMSATAGVFGGARHQYELRKILGALDARALPKPEVLIGSCHTKFDAEGNLTDAATRQAITSWMTAFSAWIDLLQEGQAAVANRTRNEM